MVKGLPNKYCLPFFNGGGDGGELPDICGCTKKFGAEWFTKESYWVVVLL